MLETNATAQAELFGLVAEFEEPEELLHAAEQAHEAGYIEMDAYTPMPIEGLAEAIGFRRTLVEQIVFVAGILGATGGFMLCWWMTVVAYPHIVAGRPLNSWPAYIPITFESMVLVSCIVAVIAMLMLNGLPHPYHPLFNVKEFERATRDRFFLCIETKDPKFDMNETRSFLESLEPLEVMEVEP